jgi:AcrR family transcriptional regulator
MKQEKQDRRSQRTRQLVVAAMTELLQTKRYDAITVQDLLDRAGIGRSTFYAHYYDKEDLLAAVVERQIAMMRRHLPGSDAGQHILPSLELFRHIRENYQIFQPMVRGRAGEAMWDACHVILCRVVEQALVIACPADSHPSVPLEVMAQYLAGAFWNLLKWWLEADMPYTPERMDSIFQQLALPGVWAMLGRADK